MAVLIPHSGRDDLAEREREYNRTLATPLPAAQYGYIDDILRPSQVRAACAVRSRLCSLGH